jgi:negative regulator of genetic competence, sporulation and motility
MVIITKSCKDNDDDDDDDDDSNDNSNNIKNKKCAAKISVVLKHIVYSFLYCSQKNSKNSSIELHRCLWFKMLSDVLLFLKCKFLPPEEKETNKPQFILYKNETI